jgi:aminopeptidase N
LTLRLDPALARVDGSERVVFTATQTTRRLVFRLWPNGPVQRREGARLDVGSIRADRQVRTERPDPTTLVLRPTRPLRARTQITVRLEWTLRLPHRVRDRNSAFTSGLRLGSFYPILAWDPRRGWATDPPSLVPGEASTSPVADYDVRVSAPRGLTVVASGTRVRAGHFVARAVRDVAVAAGRFNEVAGVALAPQPVRVHVLIRDLNRASLFLAYARTDLTLLSRLYGPYPWSDYWLVVPPDLFAAGIEYPTLSYVSDSSFVDIFVRHETAHQWFYSLVGNNQARDPWLDETLASWAQGQAAPYPAPPPSAAHRLGAPMTYWSSHRLEYGEVVYGLGPKLLARLGPRGKVDCALRLYVARNAYRIARPRDLLAALDAVLPGSSRKLARWGVHP